MQLSPARGRLPELASIQYTASVDAAYPREGTVTNHEFHMARPAGMQLIPAMGRFPVANALTTPFMVDAA